jgi:hypothetical protein
MKAICFLIFTGIGIGAVSTTFMAGVEGRCFISYSASLQARTRCSSFLWSRTAAPPAPKLVSELAFCRSQHLRRLGGLFHLTDVPFDADSGDTGHALNWHVADTLRAVTTCGRDGGLAVGESRRTDALHVPGEMPVLGCDRDDHCKGRRPGPNRTNRPSLVLHLWLVTRKKRTRRSQVHPNVRKGSFIAENFATG